MLFDYESFKKQVVDDMRTAKKEITFFSAANDFESFYQLYDLLSKLHWNGIRIHFVVNDKTNPQIVKYMTGLGGNVIYSEHTMHLIVIDKEIDLEWARIPHFYYDYYVYQYATGYSAAIALSRRILKEGEPAVKDYLNFLSGGCSADPITLLRGAGVDMATTQPITEALKLFDELITEMEQLMEA